MHWNVDLGDCHGCLYYLSQILELEIFMVIQFWINSKVLTLEISSAPIWVALENDVQQIDAHLPLLNKISSSIWEIFSMFSYVFLTLIFFF